MSKCHWKKANVICNHLGFYEMKLGLIAKKRLRLNLQAHQSKTFDRDLRAFQLPY